EIGKEYPLFAKVVQIGCDAGFASQRFDDIRGEALQDKQDNIGAFRGEEPYRSTVIGRIQIPKVLLGEGAGKEILRVLNACMAIQIVEEVPGHIDGRVIGEGL